MYPHRRRMPYVPAGLAIASLLLCVIACAPTTSDSETLESTAPTATGPEEFAEPVVFEVSITESTFVAGSRQTARVALRNTSDTTQTVADILGVRVIDGTGETVFDSVPVKPNYPTVMIDLGPGDGEERRIEFDVPPPGTYRLEAYLWDYSTTSSGAVFTSTPPG